MPHAQHRSFVRTLNVRSPKERSVGAVRRIRPSDPSNGRAECRTSSRLQERCCSLPGSVGAVAVRSRPSQDVGLLSQVDPNTYPDTFGESRDVVRVEPTASSTVLLRPLDTLRARVSTLEPDLRWSDRRSTARRVLRSSVRHPREWAGEAFWQCRSGEGRAL
ncbi:MAG: hypothetical protein RL591_1096 [Planctomycetota bacterium]